jgi:hypothetical protein
MLASWRGTLTSGLFESVHGAFFVVHLHVISAGQLVATYAYYICSEPNVPRLLSRVEGFRWLQCHLVVTILFFHLVVTISNRHLPL